MDYTAPEFWPQLKDLAGRIDGLDYYQILNLGSDATSAQVKTSYYQLARALHPDKFFTISDEQTRLAVHKIYKRVTESYSVLKDETKRKRYTELIAGPERAAHLRYDEKLEAEEKKEQREKVRVAKTPQGDKAYQAAVIDIKNERWDQAFRNVQSALLFEPANDQLKKLLEELKQKRGK